MTPEEQSDALLDALSRGEPPCDADPAAWLLAALRRDVSSRDVSSRDVSNGHRAGGEGASPTASSTDAPAGGEGASSTDARAWGEGVFRADARARRDGVPPGDVRALCGSAKGSGGDHLSDG
ncbi:hypothetical protein ACGF0J_00480 [Nonomuraea sp. NPDC047897]|uniref:hypothetical protein n=1 Tax=Nonomuraea sp. NPDC047897 TaxID=3364346 RepID=UPI00371F8099